MREIKFRAWNKIERVMTNDFRNDRAYLGDCGILVHWSQHDLMQFTGLLDKNGKEIYEGDVVRNENDKKPNQQIIFVNGMFCLDDEESPLWRYDPKNFWEVIGNVWENPERITPSA